MLIYVIYLHKVHCPTTCVFPLMFQVALKSDGEAQYNTLPWLSTTLIWR